MARTVPGGPEPIKAGWVALMISPLTPGFSKVTSPLGVLTSFWAISGSKEKLLLPGAVGVSVLAAVCARKSWDWPRVMSGTGLSLAVVVIAGAVPCFPPCAKRLIIV